MKRIAITGMLLVATVSVLNTVMTSPAMADPPFECLKVLNQPTENGNKNAACEPEVGGSWVKAKRELLLRPLVDDVWCARVEPGQTTGVKGWGTMINCLLPITAVNNAGWVRVKLNAQEDGNKGGTNSPEFKILSSVKTLKGTIGAENEIVTSIETVKCEQGTHTGEISGMRTISKIVEKLNECSIESTEAKEKGEVCTIKSVGAKEEGEIVTRTLKGELGTMKETEASSEVGLLLEPETTKTWTTLSSTKCGIELSMVGSLAGEILPVSVKSSIYGLYFETSGKSQAIKSITVASGVKKPELELTGVSAVVGAEDELEFGNEVEIL